MWLELSSKSDISSPLWSVVGEYHWWWCALKSPVSIVESVVSTWFKQLVMSSSRFSWLGFCVSLGAMYILKILRCLWLDKCNFICCVSMVLILHC